MKLTYRERVKTPFHGQMESFMIPSTMHPAASRTTPVLPTMDEPARKGFVLFSQNIGVKFGGSRNACRLMRSFYTDALEQWQRLDVREKETWIHRARSIPSETLRLPEPPKRGRVQKLYDLQFSYTPPSVAAININNALSVAYNYRMLLARQRSMTPMPQPATPNAHLRLSTIQSAPMMQQFLGRGNPVSGFNGQPAPLPSMRKKVKNPLKAKSRPELLRKQEQRRIDFRPMPTVDEDDCEEDEIGTPAQNLQDEVNARELNEKFIQDKEMIYEAIMDQTGGCIDKIRNLRFLVASVQTFGNMDNVCVPAEFAMNEMNLLDGVIDHFSTEVGPWTLDNELQVTRALSVSDETHCIPLHVENARFTKRELCSQILGRTEPQTARKQGICVGLYTDESEDFESRLNRLYLGDKDPYHIVDRNNRRFIVVLRQEYHYLRSAMKYLRDEVKLEYDGFPVTADRFVLADALVAALAECVGGEALPECSKWLGALGERLPFGYLTPWEREGELFCVRHRRERNVFCAAVTCSRSCFIMLHSLDHLYALI